MVAAGNSRLFYTTNGTTLTQFGGTYSGDLWQFATLNGKLFAAQVGHSLRWFDETTFAETTVATPSNPRAIHAAYGRLWALSSDGWTLHWSDLLDGTNFTTGASGSLNLQRLHAGLRTPGVAIVGFDRGVVVLCADAALVLGLADDLNPNNTAQPIYLREILPQVGCIARDTAVNIGEDVLFLGKDGVGSLRRSLAERQGAAPLVRVSEAVRDELIQRIAQSGIQDCAAFWEPTRLLYHLFIPLNSETWVLDFAFLDPERKLPRVYRWTHATTKLPYSGTFFSNRRAYFGIPGFLATNDSYSTAESYTMAVETGWLSFEAPAQLKHLKRWLLNLYGGSGQTAVVKWFTDFNSAVNTSVSFQLRQSTTPAQFGISEFNVGEFSIGLSAADNPVQAGRSAKFFKFRFECPITGYEVTLNNVQVYYALGKVV